MFFFDRIKVLHFINTLGQNRIANVIINVIGVLTMGNKIRIKVDNQTTEDLPTAGIRQMNSLSSFVLNLVIDEIKQEIIYEDGIQIGG